MNTDFHVPRISGGRALIAGGCSKIGLATAREFIDMGIDTLVFVGPDEDRARTAIASLEDQARIEFIQADCFDPKQAAHAINVAESSGAVHFVVTSPADSDFAIAPINRTDIESYATTLTRLTLPSLHVTHAALALMRQRRGGVIVNIACDAAEVPIPGKSVIGAAMASIVMFSRIAALEAKPDGVRINVLTPSLGLGPSATDPAEHTDYTTPDGVARSIAFLCDHRSARTSGQVISLNGGLPVSQSQK